MAENGNTRGMFGAGCKIPLFQLGDLYGSLA